jgi:hypothetical protein
VTPILTPTQANAHKQGQSIRVGNQLKQAVLRTPANLDKRIKPLLHGILAGVRDLNLQLISVTTVD